MKALILNSGMGSRMGVLTSEHPKCMTDVSETETILSRQLKQIAAAGVKQVVMTTGYFDQILVDYCHSLKLPLEYEFVRNPLYNKTNYIYSIYCAKACLDDDVIMMHGDLVYEDSVFEEILNHPESCVAVSTTLPLPEKDFKAVLSEGRVAKVGIEFFDNAVACQPLYKLLRKDWKVWLDRIVEFCESDRRTCYAENAFNEVSGCCQVMPYDVKDRLCNEIDTPEDLEIVAARVRALG